MIIINKCNVSVKYINITWVGPGANPSAQMHSKPPCRLVHVPLPHMLTLALHSFSSMHFFPVESRTYPAGHSHRYDPSVFMHSPPSHGFVMKSHSFRSSPLSPRPTPSGHNLANASAAKKEEKNRLRLAQFTRSTIENYYWFPAKFEKTIIAIARRFHQLKKKMI